MNRYFFVLYCSIYTVIFFLGAGSNEELFLQANKQYQQQAFHDALASYTMLSPKTAAVWENMGNSAFYLADFPHAVLYWQRAERDVGFQRYYELEKRIYEAFQKLDVVDDAVWYEKITTLIVVSMRCFPLWVWQLLCILSWILLLFAVSLCRRPKTYVGALLVSITLLLFVLSLLSYWHNTKQFAIVTGSQAALHTGTDPKLPLVSALKRGQRIRIIDTASDWYRASAQGKAGWVYKDMVEIV